MTDANLGRPPGSLAPEGRGRRVFAELHEEASWLSAHGAGGERTRRFIERAAVAFATLRVWIDAAQAPVTPPPIPEGQGDREALLRILHMAADGEWPYGDIAAAILAAGFARVKASR